MWKGSNLTLLAFLSTLATASSTFILQSDLPHDKWVSLQRNVEFLPATNEGRIPNLDGRKLQSSSSNSNGSPYSVQPFVEAESDYDEYQQAWRYLGFMIDCNDYTYANAGDDDDGGSGDGGTGEGCHRYVLWAAYVDLNYQGGGIGEYQFWDRQKKKWDATSCKYAEQGSGDKNNNDDGESRCAKMDCHLEDSETWSLLGIFKHKDHNDWMEQLFKHEGYCVWTDEEYTFMSSARKAWPEACTASSVTNSDGSYIYYDIKPTSAGGITFGLYTDTRCTEGYRGSKSVDTVLGNILLEGGSGDSHDNGDYDFSSYSFSQSLSAWESAFNAWKICHPCVSYDLNNVGYNADDDASRGSAYGTYTYGYDDDYNYNNYGVDNGHDFDCYDQAGYTNVNQCMKFMAKTEMYSATFRDLALASTQGTLVNYVEGYTAGVGKPKSAGVTVFFFLLSTVVLAGGVYMVHKARKDLQNVPQFVSKEPFVFA